MRLCVWFVGLLLGTLAVGSALSEFRRTSADAWNMGQTDVALSKRWSEDSPSAPTSSAEAVGATKLEAMREERVRLRPMPKESKPEHNTPSEPKPKATIKQPSRTQKGFRKFHSGATKLPCVTDVCLVIDGSDSVSKASFQAEKKLSLLLAKALLQRNYRGSIGAVQFGTVAREVASLTTDVVKFGRYLSAMQQVGGGRNSNGGFLGCRVVLDKSPNKRQAVVLMTNGESTIGGPIKDQVRAFRESVGDVYIVSTANLGNEWGNKVLGGASDVLHVAGQTKAGVVFAAQKLAGKICAAQ